MALWQHYATPGSVDEALAALSESHGPSRVIAGGTDLLLDLDQGRTPPVHTLIDVTRISEMRAIRETEPAIFVGAAATHAEIVSSALLQETAACLVEACSLIGGPQVRNVATLGGNVAHALPAGDGTIALLALAAEAWIAGPHGRRWEPVDSLIRSPGVPTFQRESEILVGFRFAPATPSAQTCFRRVMRPQGVAIAILNMAAWIRWGEAGRVEDVRLAVGPAGPRPLRARAAEACLRGSTLEAADLARAARELDREVHLRTSPHRATAEYRHLLLEVILRRVLRGTRPAAEGQGEREVA